MVQKGLTTGNATEKKSYLASISISETFFFVTSPLLSSLP